MHDNKADREIVTYPDTEYDQANYDGNSYDTSYYDAAYSSNDYSTNAFGKCKIDILPKNKNRHFAQK